MNTTPFLYFFTFVQTNPANTSILFSMPLFYFMRSVLKRTQEGCIHVCHATYKPEITPNLFFPANILKHSRTNKINIFSPPYLFKIHILYVFFFFYFCWFLWYINCSNSVHYIILKPQRVDFHRASGISTGANRLCTKLSNLKSPAEFLKNFWIHAKQFCTGTCSSAFFFCTKKINSQNLRRMRAHEQAQSTRVIGKHSGTRTA